MYVMECVVVLSIIVMMVTIFCKKGKKEAETSS